MQDLARKRETNRRWYARKRALRRQSEPPDPLLSLNEIDRAYMAGLLDGEGCFRIGRVGPLKKSYYPIIAIGMTDRCVIEWVRSKWQSGTIKLNNHTCIKRNGTLWKHQWLVRIHGKRAKLLCEVLLPFLKVKKSQAQAIIEFPTDCRNGPGRTIPITVQATRTQLFERVRELNKRGIRTTVAA